MLELITKKRCCGPTTLRLRPSGALQFTPRVLRQMKGVIKLHNPEKFLEDSSFGSHLSDLQKLA